MTNKRQKKFKEWKRRKLTADLIVERSMIKAEREAQRSRFTLDQNEILRQLKRQFS